MVVLLAAFNSFDTISKSQAYQADRTQNLDDMRGVLQRMTKELRQATSVTDPGTTPASTTYRSTSASAPTWTCGPPTSTS